VAAGAVLAAYLVAFVAAGPGVARGATVLGVEIGGQSTEEATATLQRELRDEVRAAIPVRASESDATAKIRPARAGLALDVEATVEAARARSWNPIRLLGSLVDAGDIDPVVTVDRPELRAAVDRVAGRVDREKVEGSVRFGAAGVPKPVAPVEGVAVSRKKAVDRLAEVYLTTYLDDGKPVALPSRVRPPDVSRAEVQRVTDEVAVPATASDVILTVEGTQVALSPREIASALSFEPDGEGSLQLVVDPEQLHDAVAKELAPVEEPARDASFRIRNGSPKVVPAKAGRAVVPETLAAAVQPVLALSGPARAVTVPLEESQPEVTTEMAQGLGVTEKVATYTTYYPSDFAPRLTNIHRAADLLDDTLVLPGKVFSFNDTVGERTAERGFAAGFIINNGQLEVDYGGGVSQLVTTAFNAFFFSGLEILEHNPHSFYISRYPEGRESTIAWGYKDLRVRNDSDQGIFITTGYTNSSVTVTVWGTKRYRIESTKSERYDIKPFRVIKDTRDAGTEKGDCVATDGVPGFRVIVHRLFYENGQQVKSEEFRTRYLPENEVSCAAPGDDKP
jgi:vancomycin resistance protein YoaR